jgi:hypothetical protein
MYIAILWAVLLSTATADTVTTIIEYPDHYYVESVGISQGKPAPSQDDNLSPAKATPIADNDSNPPLAGARPVTDFDNSPQSVDPERRRAAMEGKIQRLQRERSTLMTPQEGETSDQANRRQQEALGRLRKLNKISSELTKVPGPASD